MNIYCRKCLPAMVTMQQIAKGYVYECPRCKDLSYQYSLELSDYKQGRAKGNRKNATTKKKIKEFKLD